MTKPIPSIKKIVNEDEQIPIHYGLAWYCMDRYAMVCYPVPLNIVLRLLRTIWIKLTYPDWVRDLVFDMRNKGWQTGYNNGYTKGYEKGYEKGNQTNQTTND